MIYIYIYTYLYNNKLYTSFCILIYDDVMMDSCCDSGLHVVLDAFVCKHGGTNLIYLVIGFPRLHPDAAIFLSFFGKAAVKSGNLPPAVAASRGLHRRGLPFAWVDGRKKNHWLDNVTVWMILLGKLQVYLFKAPIFSAKNM